VTYLLHGLLSVDPQKPLDMKQAGEVGGFSWPLPSNHHRSWTANFQFFA